jgi:hypothetical protein
VAVGLVPIIAQTLQTKLHGAAGQIWAALSFKDQESVVVGDKRQADTPLLIGPSDPVITVCEMKTARTPTEQGQPFAFMFNYIASCSPTNQRHALEVVLFVDELLINILFLLTDKADFELIKDLLFT